VDGESGAPVFRQDPSFLRVRLANVDGQERDPVGKPVGEVLERPNLGAKGRSGVGAEDERNGPFGEERREA
jgi:hypothetical protein